MSSKGRTDNQRDVERGQPSEVGSDYIFDKEERKKFVSKVYAILSIQLGITFAIVFSTNFSEETREFMIDYFWIMYIFMVVALIFYCVLICSYTVRRMYPLNLILLTVHTLFFAALTSWVSARYEIAVIWMAFLATAIVTLSVSLFAAFSPWDVTGCGIFLLIGFIALMFFSIVAVIVNMFMVAPLLHTILSGVAVLLLSFYLMFMTQLILGGRKGQLEPDEVILGVILLYVTIVEIFLNLLQLIGACSGN